MFPHKFHKAECKRSHHMSPMQKSNPLESVCVPPFKQDAKKRGLRPRENSSFFTKITEYFSAYFHHISTLAGALKYPHKSWTSGCRA